MVSNVCGGNQLRISKTSASCLQSSMVVGVSWFGAAWVLPALGSYSSLREPWMPTCLKQSMVPSLRRLGRRAVFQHDNDHCLAKEAEGKGDGLAKHVSKPKPYWASVWASSKGRCRSARSLTSTSSMMSSCGRVEKDSCVNLWTPCPRGFRQCLKIMVATQNIDTLGPI